MVKTLCFNASGTSLIPGQGANIPHASGPETQSNIVTNSIKTLKMVHSKHFYFIVD